MSNVPRPASTVRPAMRSGAPSDESIHASRLASVVAMIENLTGREVKLVPPSAYLVSGSSKPPAVAPVELVHSPDLSAHHGTATGPLEVGISSVLRTGTASRMVLSQDRAGALDLRAAVDLGM